jgi:hypothetical protein
MATANFKITNFTSKLTHGGARPNLFEVNIGNIPAIVKTKTGSSDFKFFCKSFQIPGSVLGTYELPYFGRTIKFAGDRQFAEFTTTVINDEGYAMRNIFDSWLNGLNDHKSNVSGKNLGSRTMYTSDMTLTTYKKLGTADQTYKFIGCWPSAVSSIDLNWDSTNAIQEFSVTWQYDHYTHAESQIT